MNKHLFAVFCLAAILNSSPLFAEEDAMDILNAKSAKADAELSDLDKAPNDYILQAGDVVLIKIYPEDEYIKGGKMEVSSEGNITLSLVGKVTVAGKSVVEAEREIAEILNRDYLVDPEVVIELEQHKKQNVVLLGQVRKPGTYEMPIGAKKMTLLQAVSLAGGFSEIANIKKIKIVRQAEGKNEVIRANADAIISGSEQDVDLEPGDVISVSESLF